MRVKLFALSILLLEIMTFMPCGGVRIRFPQGIYVSLYQYGYTYRLTLIFRYLILPVPLIFAVE